MARANMAGSHLQPGVYGGAIPGGSGVGRWGQPHTYPSNEPLLSVYHHILTTNMLT